MSDGRTEGLMDWRNINKIVKQHEISKEYTNCQIVFLRRSNNIGRIDSDLCIQINNEIDYWKNVLKQVIAVIKKLGNRGLPFRGSVEKFGSQNNGNFMICLELISEFDPFLSNHIVQHETRVVVIHLTFLLQHVMK
ncbi:zinc finger MYM-type protein 1-like [Aphis craccivora]|uniref:Zinc finger MYM-type protein 1-like n=1 Tax=Aphis craccivora TaxID=307492 RepID=A0A6G0Y6M3_APHCR|nr:zinc finger MYM-type protein 1-like [Aphis craccivora]